MAKTLEDIIKVYGNKLNSYADEESKKIEAYLAERGIEIYDIVVDADNIDKCSITIADLESYLRYLEKHSIKEVFKFKEVLEKQSFLMHFMDRMQEETFDEVENNEENIESTYNLYCAYLDDVIGDNICSRIIYCIATNPMIIFSYYSDLDKIIEVENEIIQESTQGENNEDALIERINAAEDELDKAFEFLVNNSDFNECTNATLRNSFKRRELLFENGRFSNLRFVIDNRYKIITTGEKDISKRAKDIFHRYDIIYELAWKEIKYGR